MSQERRGLGERLTVAFASSNLAQSDLRLTDADLLGALGYAGRRVPLASALLRLYLTHAPGSASEAVAQTVPLVARESRAQQLKLSARELAGLAKAALTYCADPVCPRCHGTRYQVIPGSVSLGNVPCALCQGDGRRVLPVRHRKLLAHVVGRIEQIESILFDLVQKRL